MEQDEKQSHRRLMGRVVALAGRAWNCCVQTCCRKTPTADRPRSASTISPPSERTQKHVDTHFIRPITSGDSGLAPGLGIWGV